MKFRKFAVVLGAGLAVAALGASAASAKTCELAIEGNDAMQYNKKELIVEKDCTEVKVTLKHSGKLPKAAMGHDFVVTKAADMQPVATAGLQAGLTANYLPKNDPRVIGATTLVGGGETASVTIAKDKLKAGEDYKFFCTFPGHSAVMNGKFIVKTGAAG